MPGGAHEVDVGIVVVGAGPAGLATAAMLRRAGVRPVTVVERGEGVASAWRGRYDSLRLHTIRWLSGLPGMPIPKEYGRWVARDDLVRYLEGYCARFALTPRFGVDVRRVSREDGHWRLQTSEGDLRAATVVIATGTSNVAYVPDWPGREGFPRPLVHSADYRNPDPYGGQGVLVVGAGNSAAEIALDLVNGGAASVELAVRTPPNIVRRDTFGVPSQLLGIVLRNVPERVMNPLSAGLRKMTIPDLSAYGLPAPPGDGFSQFLRTMTVPILDSGFVAAIRDGRIRVRSGVAAMDDEQVVHLDGSRSQPDAVIAATGYRPGLAPMVGDLGLLNDAGFPRIAGGRTSRRAPNLYTVGISVQLSGLLREISRDARGVAAHIARHR